jgi:hypothetical protein
MKDVANIGINSETTHYKMKKQLNTNYEPINKIAKKWGLPKIWIIFALTY